MKNITTVLFDLDGTLLDTVPTFEKILNQMRAQQGKSALSREQYTPLVSHGSKAMIEFAFAEHPIDEQAILREQFLDIYDENLEVATKPLPGIEDLLAKLEQSGYKWGVISNKATKFTKKLCHHFGWSKRAKVIFGGDSTPKRKPSPMPLLMACERIGVNPEQCIYVGDAHKDIIAGKAAGMFSAVADFGYIMPPEDPKTWGADMILQQPLDLMRYLN